MKAALPWSLNIFSLKNLYMNNIYSSTILNTHRLWNKPSVHQVMNGYTIWDIAIQWNIIQPSKRMKYWSMLQHGRTLKTLLNERSQTQKATYRMIPFTHETSRIDKSIETECKLVIARGWGRGKESGLSLNIVIPFYVCVFYFLSFSFKFPTCPFVA